MLKIVMDCKELLDKTMEHLNKNPLIAPNISKKENS
jgi:hypothetical protein